MNNIQSWKPTYNYNLTQTDFQQGLPNYLILKIFLLLAERNEDRQILSLSATCKRFREILGRKSDAIFNAFFSRIPDLQDYKFSGKYFDLYREHKLALKNIQNGNYKTYGPFKSSIVTTFTSGPYRSFTAYTINKFNNNIIILSDKNNDYIWNALNTSVYQTDFVKMDFTTKPLLHSKFQIKDMKDHCLVLDLASGQNKKISLCSIPKNSNLDQYKFCNFTSGKMELCIGNPMFPDEKSFLTISLGNRYSHINIWNLETGLCEKTIKNIADSECAQKVYILCERLPCVIYKGLESKTRYVLHDIEKNKQYEYQVNNALFENGTNDLSAFVPYVSDQYIVYYSSNDDLITFVDRESGQKYYKDLGSFKENTDAIKFLRNDHFINPYQVKAAYLNEEKGLFLWANAESINVVSLKNGTEYKHNLRNNFHPFNEKTKLIIKNNLVVYSVAQSQRKNSFIVLEMDSLKLLEEIDTLLRVGSDKLGEHFFFISQTEIYNTKLQKKVTLESYDSDKKHVFSGFKSWKNFLAVLNKVVDKDESSLSIFDMDTGKRCIETSIPFFVNSTTPFFSTFDWVHGGILARNEKSAYFINFNVDHDFPKDFQPL